MSATGPDDHVWLGCRLLGQDHGRVSKPADPESHDAIIQDFHHWDAVDVHFRGETIRSNGPRLSAESDGGGLLNIFSGRARFAGRRAALSS